MSPAVEPTGSSNVRIATAFALVLLAFVTVLDCASAWAGQPDPIRRARRAVHGRYIVGLRAVGDPDALAAMSQSLGRGRVRHVYRHAARGFAIEASEASARALASDPAVAYVEEDGVVTTAGGQSLTDDDNWGLDRIDQRAARGDGPTAYDHLYRYSADGAGVNVYVLDTGIRTTHVEFGGRAFRVFSARGYEPDVDCHGHGTHVAGIAGGVRYGVAKSVTLHSLRVIGCEGFGYVSDIVAAVDWITANAVRPAVINMSLGAGPSEASMRARGRYWPRGLPSSQRPATTTPMRAVVLREGCPG